MHRIISALPIGCAWAAAASHQAVAIRNARKEMAGRAAKQAERQKLIDKEKQNQ
jgi:hypothetical protein